MKRYLVGGAVRDARLGRPVSDRDWVVTGATPERMVAHGFKPVGKDFPVFLDPDTKEEVALARTERKTARGYHGFQFDTSPDVTLEEDLGRRDLTINAMAEDPSTGALIDPWGGAADLEARLLRHVSPAFAEDPVRILRVARFASRFTGDGFRIANETWALMRSMVASGEVDALVPERVWQEMVRAFTEPNPEVFVQVLRRCGALARLLPEVDRLYGVPQRVRYHPEIDTGLHTELVLQACAQLAPGQARIAFAGLMHDLGKGLTPKAEWPRHHRHEQLGAAPVEAVCARLKAPREFERLATRACRLHLRAHCVFEMKPGKVLKLIEEADGLRQPKAFEELVVLCEADKRGRLGQEEAAYPQAEFLRATRDAAAAVDTAPILDRGLTGKAVGEALRAARIDAIRAVPR